MESFNWASLIPVFIAALAASLIGPYVKSKFERRNAKKTAKLGKRPETYEQLILFLIADSDLIDLEKLKAELLTYANDYILDTFRKYLKGDGEIEILRNEIIRSIRDELEMGSTYPSDTISVIVNYSRPDA